LLEQAGHRATAFATVSEARSLLQDEVPDLLATDAVLIDGSSTSLVQQAEAAGAKILIMTGKLRPDRRVGGSRPGVLVKAISARPVSAADAGDPRGRLTPLAWWSVNRELKVRPLQRCRRGLEIGSASDAQTGHGNRSRYFVTFDQKHAAMRRRQPDFQRLLIVLRLIPSSGRIRVWKFDDEYAFRDRIAFQQIDLAAPRR
jgi:hypothetical protein